MEKMSYQIKHGDCLDIMAEYPDNYFDSIITDPPYGLKFMGKKWDHGIPGVEYWAEALRVAKPGAFLFAFGGTRTFHRLTSSIEDAGWEIRDCVMWVYGSGFPKSLDISKAIDKSAGVERKVIGPNRFEGLNGKNLNVYSAAKRSEASLPATEFAKQWDGFGTALKPAYEPIILARKPIDGTVANNVLKWGCGGLNIDGCRIETTSEKLRGGGDAGHLKCGEGFDRPWKHDPIKKEEHAEKRRINSLHAENMGRFPANLILDDSECVRALFPETGASKAAMRGEKTSDGTHPGWSRESHKGFDSVRGHNDNGGSAARFFYTAKASGRDRDAGCSSLPTKLIMRFSEKAQGPLPQQTPSKPVPQKNTHPTVKPTTLMAYLVRLITPQNGIVLDPFCGSGSTGKAAILENFNFIGIEKDIESVEIAKARCEQAKKNCQLKLI